MRDVGIEILTTSATGQTSRQFIPSSKVRNMIIYEYVTPWRVHTLMGILVTKVNKIVLGFNYELGMKTTIRVWKMGKKVMMIN